MKIIIEFQEQIYKDEAGFRVELANLCKRFGYDCIEYNEEIYELPERVSEALEQFLGKELIIGGQ
ncbi:MAG: hypothetical protein WD512_00310 [Candidatus Paceibacterota bacterium]